MRLFILLICVLFLSSTSSRDLVIDGDLYNEMDTVLQKPDGIFFLYYAKGFHCFGSEKKEANQGKFDTLLFYLRQHNQITIELSAYTDCRGKDWYNKLLSQRVADYHKKYLVSKGIDKDRIIPVGYGGERPLAICKDDKCWECTEKQHEKNRSRLGIRILNEL